MRNSQLVMSTSGIEGVGSGVGAVSYTHLDVYKRQAYVRVSTQEEQQVGSFEMQIVYFKSKIESNPD